VIDSGLYSSSHTTSTTTSYATSRRVDKTQDGYIMTLNHE